MKKNQPVLRQDLVQGISPFPGDTALVQYLKKVQEFSCVPAVQEPPEFIRGTVPGEFSGRNTGRLSVGGGNKVIPRILAAPVHPRKRAQTRTQKILSGIPAVYIPQGVSYNLPVPFFPDFPLQDISVPDHDTCFYARYFLPILNTPRQGIDALRDKIPDMIPAHLLSRLRHGNAVQRQQTFHSVRSRRIEVHQTPHGPVETSVQGFDLIAESLPFPPGQSPYYLISGIYHIHQHGRIVRGELCRPPEKFDAYPVRNGCVTFPGHVLYLFQYAGQSYSGFISISEVHQPVQCGGEDAVPLHSIRREGRWFLAVHLVPAFQKRFRPGEEDDGGDCLRVL